MKQIKQVFQILLLEKTKQILNNLTVALVKYKMILYFDTIGEIVLRRSVALALSRPVKSTSHQSFACSFHMLHSGSPQVFFLSTPRLLRIPRDTWLCSSAAQLCYTNRITKTGHNVGFCRCQGRRESVQAPVLNAVAGAQFQKILASGHVRSTVPET